MIFSLSKKIQLNPKETIVDAHWPLYKIHHMVSNVYLVFAS